jgi:hypothetical protein
MMGGAWRHFRFGAGVAVGWLVALVSATAWSAPLPSGRVALLDSPESSPLVRNCLTRIREELASGGFEVSVIDPGPRTDPVSIVAVMQAQQEAVAAIALLGDPERPGAELWILDRIGAVAEVRRLPVPAEDVDHLPEVLAIRTMELLNASALKALVEAVRARRELPPRVADGPKARPEPPEPRHSVGLEAGISMLASVGGPGPAALPLARVRGRLSDRLFVRLTLAGLGTRPRIETPIGSASVVQSLGLAELVLALRPGASWRPSFSLGAGALHVQSDGEGVWPYAGQRQTRWVAASDAGVGLVASIDARFSFAFEIHALVAVPHPKLRFYDVESATLAFPAVLASFTMVAWP